MVMIPSDVGVRMRMQTDALPLQPTAPVAEIPSDLPDLRPGQTFTARIQEVLPEATYKALVAGKQITLQLPEGARAGDTLELVVIDRTPKAIIAQLAPGADAAGKAAGAYEHASFSPAARLLSQLLLPEGATPQPAALNRGRPLLAEPPQAAAAATAVAATAVATPGAALAQALQQAVGSSGLFYEAHQAQWIAGRLPTAQLLQEPQGRQSSAALLAEHGLPPPRAEAAATPEAVTLGNRIVSLLQTLFGGSARSEESSATPTAATPTPAAATLPEELRPLVQQQLDAAGTQRMAWHGEVWPRQTMDWEIEWQRPDDDATAREDDLAAWRTSLHLTTPRLGRIDASLQLTAAGVRIVLATPYGASAADLRDESPQLANALAAAGVPLIAFAVKHETD